MTTFTANIPRNVGPGQPFQVHLPNGVLVNARCPVGCSGGDSFTIAPYNVRIPLSVAPGNIFHALVDGQEHPVRAPSRSRPGDTMQIFIPKFTPGGSGDKQPQHSKDSFDQNKWENFLDRLKTEAPDLRVDKAKNIDPDTIPNEFLCPITQEIMIQPVVCLDGHTYERAAIEEWFKDHDTSPRTNEKLPSKVLIPNHSMRTQVIEFIDNYNAAFPDQS